MFGRKHYLLLVLYLIAGLFVPRISYAVSEPTFPNCINVLAPVKVAYENGTHGIPGRTQSYQGRDTVYFLDNANLLQCFCPPDHNGIQTNWWKANGISDPDIQTLKNLGWTYVPNGELWGLENTPYLAKNIDYNCAPGQGGEIMGLASTGNSTQLYAILGMALLSLIAGFVITRRKKS